MTYGRDDTMAIAAVRYCLGRQTYIVGDCADWLIEVWPTLLPSAQAVIQRDVEDLFARDDAARQQVLTWLPMGHDCDRSEWERVRKLWETT